MINLGLTGLGKWGINYLHTIKNIKGVRIKYICALSEKTLNNFPVDYRKTTNYKDLLFYPDLDGVIIASPASTHFKIANEFIRKRIPILVEKPIVTNLTDAIKLRHVADKYKSPVIAGHIYLYHPAIRKMKQLLPKLGQLQYIETQGGNLGPFRNDVSALWDWAPHDISICLYLAGNEPLTVQAWGENITKIKSEPDNIHFRMNFPDNIVSLSSIGRMFPFKRRSVLALGKYGAIFFDDTQEKKLIYYSFSKNQSGIVTKNIQYPEFEKITPLQKELEVFISYIENKQSPETNINHAISVIGIIDQIEKSLINTLVHKFLHKDHTV